MAAALEWSKRVSAWQASGEGAEAFAAKRGWKATTLRWWGSKLRQSAVGGPAGRSVAVHFAKVIARPAAGAAPVEVVLARGRTVRVSEGFSPDLLRAVVQALEVA